VVPDFDKDGSPCVEHEINERVETRFVFWADWRCSPARCWEGVWWVAYAHPMD
jgi:hypothetical protein